MGDVKARRAPGGPGTGRCCRRSWCLALVFAVAVIVGVSGAAARGWQRGRSGKGQLPPPPPRHRGLRASEEGRKGRLLVPTASAWAARRRRLREALGRNSGRLILNAGLRGYSWRGWRRRASCRRPASWARSSHVQGGAETVARAGEWSGRDACPPARRGAGGGRGHPRTPRLRSGVAQLLSPLLPAKFKS